MGGPLAVEWGSIPQHRKQESRSVGHLVELSEVSHWNWPAVRLKIFALREHAKTQQQKDLGD